MLLSAQNTKIPPWTIKEIIHLSIKCFKQAYCIYSTPALKNIAMRTYSFYLLAIGFLLSSSCKKEEEEIRVNNQLQTIPVNDTLQAVITGNTLLTNTHTWYIKDWVYVSNEATIQMEPGTIVNLLPGKQGSGIVITRGAKILAKGTPYAPVSFRIKDTIDNHMWSGIVLLGRAPQHKPFTIFSNEQLAGGKELVYGGHFSADTSGILQYIEIDYVQVPALTQGILSLGTGSGTSIKDVKLHAAGKHNLTPVKKD